MKTSAALLSLLLLAGAGRAAAQTPPPPEDTAQPARVQLGPLSIRPRLILRDIGYDSNVFNEAENPKGDFGATLGARLDMSARVARVQGTYSTFYEYMYFNTYESERGSNRGVEGRAELLLGRFKPYAAAGVTASHDRPTAEIDSRAGRRQTHAAAGLNAALFSRTAITLGYRRSSVDYEDDEVFRDVSLAQELNGRADSFTVGADMELSPLTTISLSGEKLEERFDATPERDADSFRGAITATLQPLALISGRATIGIRTFRPLSPVLNDYTGLTAAIDVGYTLPGETRLNFALDRDLRHSYEQRTPYYLATGGRLTATRRLLGNVDAQVFAGAERIAYQARLDAPELQDTGTDRVRLLGGGFGYRLGDGARVALNFDHTQRSSPAADREYSRDRVYTTLSYGF